MKIFCCLYYKLGLVSTQNLCHVCGAVLCLPTLVRKSVHFFYRQLIFYTLSQTLFSFLEKNAPNNCLVIVYLGKFIWEICLFSKCLKIRQKVFKFRNLSLQMIEFLRWAIDGIIIIIVTHLWRFKHLFSKSIKFN